MKKYLKMSDVFDMQPIRLPSSWSYEMVAHAVHAINSHDELVAMNKELLEALKRVVCDVRTLADHSYGVHGLHQNGDLAPWNSLFSGGFFESWLLSVDDADAVIAKTEGGAA